MNDLEDLKKLIGPFLFVLYWVASTILSKAQDSAASTAQKPASLPPNPFGAANQKPIPTAPPKVVHLSWEDLAKIDRPEPAFESEEEIQAYRKRELRRKAELLRLAKLEKELRAKSTQVIPDMPAEKLGVPQMQLLHLVPDHSAEVHLNPDLAHQQAAAGLVSSQNALQMQALHDRLKQPGTVREAMILSVILAEPKCKTMSHKG